MSSFRKKISRHLFKIALMTNLVCPCFFFMVHDFVFGVLLSSDIQGFKGPTSFFIIITFSAKHYILSSIFFIFPVCCSSLLSQLRHHVQTHFLKLIFFIFPVLLWNFIPNIAWNWLFYHGLYINPLINLDRLRKRLRR